ncbi:hypothetical protein K2Y00_00990 [Patescibacteria group bacterium]|nr:hypothetical protein [Patescibacteria group bacterium]
MSGRTVIAILLVLVLSFGALVHALVPHNHSDGTIDLFHTALHVEQKHLDVLDAAALLLVAVLALPLLTLGRFIAQEGVRIGATLNIALRRGVLAYRRFG